MATSSSRSADRAYAFMQGNIVATENSSDLAINGRGLFMFVDDAGRELYSRNGTLRVNRNSEVTSGAGHRLIGKAWDETLGRAVGDWVPVQLVLPDGGYPVATGQGPIQARRGVRMSMNFDASSPIIPAAFPAINFYDPATFNFSTSQSVYDGQGFALTLTYYFQKFDINRWRVFASIEGVPLDQPHGVPYDPTIHDPRPLVLLDFGPDGRLSPASHNEAVVTVNDPRRPAPALLFPALPVRALEMTQFGAPFRVSRLEQDGYAWGQLTGWHFGADGVVSLSYSSGQMRKAYQLELAEFSNPGGLTPVGKHFWAASSSSGRRITSAPASGSAGSILAGALEEDFVPGR